MGKKIERNPTNLLITEGIIRNLQHNTLVANTRGWLYNIGVNLRSGLGRPVTEFDLPASRKKDTIFVVGPGASMYQYRDDLPKLREHGTVLMQPTAYPWMHRIGLEPDAIVLVDHLPIQAQLIKGATCPVICPTTADEDVAKEHDAYFFTLYLGDGTARRDEHATIDDHYFAVWNHIMAHLHRYAMTRNGWVSAMDVTNMATQIAFDFLAGANDMPKFGKRVVIVGADRCFWNNYQRVPWEGDELPVYVPGSNSREMEWRGKLTDYVMIFYVYALFELWNLRLQPLYRLDHGVMNEIPFVSMEQILQDKYPHPLSEKRIRERCERFILEEFANTIPYKWAGPEEVAEMDRKMQVARGASERRHIARGPRESERYSG